MKWQLNDVQAYTKKLYYLKKFLIIYHYYPIQTFNLLFFRTQPLLMIHIPYILTLFCISAAERHIGTPQTTNHPRENEQTYAQTTHARH